MWTIALLRAVTEAVTVRAKGAVVRSGAEAAGVLPLWNSPQGSSPEGWAGETAATGAAETAAGAGGTGTVPGMTWFKLGRAA